ncbi:hypothetical protein DRN74_05095, partial [Candidatus Micrarchaeota archaeon]
TPTSSCTWYAPGCTVNGSRGSYNSGPSPFVLAEDRQWHYYIYNVSRFGRPYINTFEWYTSGGTTYGNYFYFDQFVFTNSTAKISREDIEPLSACNISFNISGGWTEWRAMVYNTTSKLYEYNRSFNTDGDILWKVRCSGTYFETKEKNDTVKISKDIALNISKTVNLSKDGNHLVIIKYKNLKDKVIGPVIIYDFVPSNFTASAFTSTPTDSADVSGQYKGTIYIWNLGTLSASEGGNINYSLTGDGLRQLSETFVIGIDPASIEKDVEKQNGKNLEAYLKSFLDLYMHFKYHAHQEGDIRRAMPIQTKRINVPLPLPHIRYWGKENES